MFSFLESFKIWQLCNFKAMVALILIEANVGKFFTRVNGGKSMPRLVPKMVTQSCSIPVIFGHWSLTVRWCLGDADPTPTSGEQHGWRPTNRFKTGQGHRTFGAQNEVELPHWVLSPDRGLVTHGYEGAAPIESSNDLHKTVFMYHQKLKMSIRSLWWKWQKCEQLA